MRVDTQTTTSTGKSRRLKETIRVQLPQVAQRKLRAIIADGLSRGDVKKVKFNNRLHHKPNDRKFVANLELLSPGIVGLTINSECGNYKVYHSVGNLNGPVMHNIDLSNAFKEYLSAPLEAKLVANPSGQEATAESN
jgi:hypothetical protein